MSKRSREKEDREDREGREEPDEDRRKKTSANVTIGGKYNLYYIVLFSFIKKIKKNVCIMQSKSDRKTSTTKPKNNHKNRKSYRNSERNRKSYL